MFKQVFIFKCFKMSTQRDSWESIRASHGIWQCFLLTMSVLVALPSSMLMYPAIWSQDCCCFSYLIIYRLRKLELGTHGRHASTYSPISTQSLIFQSLLAFDKVHVTVSANSRMVESCVEMICSFQIVFVSFKCQLTTTNSYQGRESCLRNCLDQVGLRACV